MHSSFRVFAKRIVSVIGSVVLLAIFITLLNYTDSWIHAVYPLLPSYTMAVIFGICVTACGYILIDHFRKTEALKYEFIATITHKIRTPLTHIKWAAENIEATKPSLEQKEYVSYITGAQSKLMELTDLLAQAAGNDDATYMYKLEKGDLSAFATELMSYAQTHADSKKIKLVNKITPGVSALFDSLRLRFVLQTFIENAINYTPVGGTITVTVNTEGSKALCSVIDSGIGIPKEELGRITTKLYRGTRARATDTEGMGIGLHVSKGVIRRHHGKLIIASEGENKGSTFGFVIPKA